MLDRGAREAENAGDHAVALHLLERALRITPDNVDFLSRAVCAQYALGDASGALGFCENAVARFADRDPGYVLMCLLAELRTPGPDYRENLRAIHARIVPRTYVEIGVETGESLVLVRPGTIAVGIDPAPGVLYELPPTTMLAKQTSDEFFAQNRIAGFLGELPIDLAFIDGMHLFEHVLRDFINCERHCTVESSILLDDCWPLDARTASRERVTQFWNGDVWRMIPALRKHRTDLRIHTIATSPAGLCVIRGLDPNSRVLADRYDEIVREFREFDYATFERDRDAYLNPCPNDAESLARILS